MSNQLNALVLNHTSATVGVRELIAFNDLECGELLQKLRENQFENVLIISTCNRTEIYFDKGEKNAQLILNYIREIKKVNEKITNQFIYLDDIEYVVIYLARVSMGLESKILGDLQIFNQVKRAYQLSIEHKIVNPNLHRLMHTIFYAHKRIVKETNFKMGINSVSYAVADKIKKQIKEFVNPKILIVGVGEIGSNIVKNLIQLTNKELITITNRTDEKAQCLAARTATDYLPYNELIKSINIFDIVVFAIEINTPLIYSNDIKVEKFRPKYLFDLGVPRIIDPKTGEIPGVILYNIDEIQLQLNESRSKRNSSVTDVERIIQECCEEYFSWKEKLVASSSIKFLKTELEKIRKNEIQKQFREGNISKKESEKFDSISQNIMKKIINFHMIQFNMACQRGEADTIIEVINELFKVEKTKN